MSDLIVDPTAAPRGRMPHHLGVDYVTLESLGGQRYRTEACVLTNGTTVVIVTDNGGTSLMNASNAIAQAVDARWGPHSSGLIVIVEEWDPPFGGAGGAERFLISDRAGGNFPFDFEEWDRRGLVLPR